MSDEPTRMLDVPMPPRPAIRTLETGGPGLSVRRRVLDDPDWTIVHDFAFVHGGAEWVTGVLARDVLPASPVYYLAGDAGVAERMAPGRAQRLLTPVVTRTSYRALTPLYAASLPLRRMDGHVLASSYGFAHHVRAAGRKVVYCHSPLRQAWSGQEHYRSTGPLLERLGSRALGGWLRRTDARAARSADLYIATSRAVQDRIHAFYRQSEIPLVPPPIDNSVYNLTEFPERGADLLWVGRITEPYKRLSLLIEAVRQLPGTRLTVAGDGRDRARLEASAPPNVTFVGWQDPAGLADLYRRCSGVVFPGEDDFGLVPVEAMACGAPVLAYAAGGALDTVTDGATGTFFTEQTPAALAAALTRFGREAWDHPRIALSVHQYTTAAFSDRMVTALHDVTGADG